MKCPGCDTEVLEGVNCPKCGAVRSEDSFDSSPESRTDTQYRITLGGHQMVTSRQDLKSFMALLVLIIAMSVFALIVLELGITGDDLSTYLGVAALSVAVVVIARAAILSKEMTRWRRLLLVVTLFFLAIGIGATVVSYHQLENLSPASGSVQYVSETTEEYQKLVEIGFMIGFSAAISGLAIMWSTKPEKIITERMSQ
jgi:uncharacterized membrane protein